MAELTVESCLKELREMFPTNPDPTIHVYIWFQPDGFRGPLYEHGATLSEAMEKVRCWKELHGRTDR